jgi:hypothetical protein
MATFTAPKELISLFDAKEEILIGKYMCWSNNCYHSQIFAVISKNYT